MLLTQMTKLLRAFAFRLVSNCQGTDEGIVRGAARVLEFTAEQGRRNCHAQCGGGDLENVLMKRKENLRAHASELGSKSGFHIGRCYPGS